MSDQPLTDPVPMPRYRRWLVYAMSIGLIVGHGYDVFTRGEHWPISSYPMYSDLNPSTFKLVRLFGRTSGDKPYDVPIDPAWMRTSLVRIMREPDAQDRLRHAVTQYAEAYGWGGWAPPGEVFSTYSVWEHEWTLRADADPKRPPDTSTLLFELQRVPTAPTKKKRKRKVTTTTTTTTTPATMMGEAARDATR